ncbi:carbonate dehydratase domain containing protein [Entamoeba histolytica HM-1:IMSS-B]|uniref:Carbonic anhydrase n=5 Tax=Entamoeba histolytica TaxID=5759 RepID=C4LXK3_ENTH1|nr:carbonic anhydrase, putative [Entamoeba histolytica HM-1:IMSS]EMD44713.1 carbonic anhydrase, putative [Entamoeba histolytica KU27]EMH74162.1 carbonate dehydratase domain containing protein [Entamoeba histolytica HM-1:IMSS-B]ENY63929.1 carbonic anhydrase, putative [Entamoeba histolytica HM-1:IMSS-A]GAT93485.1 carbonic anhydrase putative [Entamoeba histolytica]EAL51300.1 carbonic anhydrase, putative [Entamoeba histolytica HM-1:IMSS]|eukprot:XP_656686.1 carbonic anhydrase, putative [Entamoeba histolytica HM-1:IMSS]
MTQLTPQQALTFLLDGNNRFVEGKTITYNFEERRKELVNKQEPIATIICCSDSRAPPEYLFNVNFGDIFVVRSAGGVIGQTELGSVEYGVTHLKTPLIVVLSHTSCGACTAACQRAHSENALSAILSDLIPIAEKCNNDIHSTCIQSAVQHAEFLRSNPLLQPLIKQGQCNIVSMIYNIETGKCEVVQ